MQPQQMAMELQVLRSDNVKFAQTIKQQNVQIKHLQDMLASKDIFEKGLTAAIAGYSSQEKASLDDGPDWVIKKSVETLNHMFAFLESQPVPPPPPAEVEIEGVPA